MEWLISKRHWLYPMDILEEIMYHRNFTDNQMKRITHKHRKINGFGVGTNYELLV